MVDKKALIISVGGSPEPLKKFISEFDPYCIYFLHSLKTKEIAEEIAEFFNIESYFKLVENHESLEEAFEKSREIIDEIKKKDLEFHVDFTGGTKTMVSGLVLAAVGEECTYSYVGAKNIEGRDKDGVGIVKDGFEKITEQKDPYDIYAILEFNKAMEFFNFYQFEASKLNFSYASEKLESKDLRKLSGIYEAIVTLYDAWDKFENVLNHKVLNSYLEQLILKPINEDSSLKEKILKDHPLFLKQMENNVEFLKLKISRKGMIKPDNVKYYLPDLLNNAYRRIEEGKYDDAVARLYRSAELIAQSGLVEQSIIDENVLKINKEFFVNKREARNLAYDDETNYKLLEFLDMLVAKKDAYNKNTIAIASHDSFKLLELLGVDFASDYLNDKKLKTNINLRNGSILAHGLKPIKKERAEELYDMLLHYSRKLYPDLDRYMEMAKFPKFNIE